MPEHDTITQAVVWTDANTAPTLAQAVGQMGHTLHTVGVGGPRSAAVEQLARPLELEPYDDLRLLLRDHPAHLLLLGTMEGVAVDDLLTAADPPLHILSLEPMAASLQTLAELHAPLIKGRSASSTAMEAATLTPLPAFLSAPGFRAAADPYEVLGEPRCLSLLSMGQPAHGSLFARLLDGWLTLLSFAAMPETIDASLTSPAGDIPETLDQLTGHLSAHARFTDGGAAVLSLCDRAGETRRQLEVIGADGHLHVTDGNYRLRHADGSEVDHTDPPQEPLAFADLVADQWQQHLHRPEPLGAASPRHADALACCLACLLSARTGQPESPHRQLEMGR